MVMGSPRQPPRRRALGAFLGLCSLLLLPGCTVVTVTATAVSVTATAVGLAADVAVGTAKVVGHGVGAAVDALSEDGAHALPPATPPPQAWCRLSRHNLYLRIEASRNAISIAFSRQHQST